MESATISLSRHHFIATLIPRWTGRHCRGRYPGRGILIRPGAWRKRPRKFHGRDGVWIFLLLWLNLHMIRTLLIHLPPFFLFFHLPARGEKLLRRWRHLPNFAVSISRLSFSSLTHDLTSCWSFRYGPHVSFWKWCRWRGRSHESYLIFAFQIRF